MNNSGITLWGAVGILAVLIVGTIVYYSFAPFAPDAPEGIVCTMDAMQCPDGSYVGRTGPNCEFVCPAAASTTGGGGGGGGGGILPYRSGVSGTVMLGPTCPVERDPPDPGCADRPYATQVSIYRAGDMARVVASVRSNAQGAYSLSLSPGQYVVRAGDSASMLPRCGEVAVTVPPTGYVTTNISCDSGIR